MCMLICAFVVHCLVSTKDICFIQFAQFSLVFLAEQAGQDGFLVMWAHLQAKFSFHNMA